MFLGVILFAVGGAFEGTIEAVKVGEELIAREVARGQRGDNLFDFGGDDVARAKLFGVEDAAEDAFRW